MTNFVPPKPASPAVTGGAGFTYADRVAARILLAVLADEMLLGNEAGIPVALRFEQRVIGALFDDLAATTDKDSRWFITCKSGEVVTAENVDKALVERAWSMIEDQTGILAASDKLVIAQPNPKAAEHTSLRKLIRWSHEQAAGQVEQFVSKDESANPHDRALWARLKGSDSKRDPQVLLSRLRLLTLDLDPLLAIDLGSVKRGGQSVLENPNTWQDLWNALLALAAEARGVAAELTIDKIVARIPSDVLLKDQGDVAEEWGKLGVWGMNRRQRTSTIGGKIALDNSSYLSDLSDRCARSRFHLVTGESGIGKSVILADWCESVGAIYLTADSLLDPAETLRRAGCVRNLEAMLRLYRQPEIIIVIDQLDRVENDQDWAHLKGWIRTLSSDARVKLIFGCAASASYRQYVQLAPALGQGLAEYVIERPTDHLLKQVAEVFPQFAQMLKDYAPSPLLLTPRSLDQLVKMGEANWPSLYADFIDLFWRNRVQPPEGDAVVRQAAKELAQHEALTGIGRLPDTVSADALRTLKARSIVIDDGNSLSWDHDTTGDNIRAKILLDLDEEEALDKRLPDCVFNPIWRRAFRLFCIAVIEREGASGFDRLMSLLTSNDEKLLELTLFDAIILGNPRLGLPTLVAPSLKGDVGLMKRFVSRFLFTGAEPLPGLRADEGDGGLWTRAHVRLPKWSRWLPTARMVAEEYRWFAEHAYKEGLEVLSQYLEAAGNRDFLGATRPALLLAHKAIRDKSYGEYAQGAKALAFRACIFTLAFEPRSAKRLLRRVVARQGPEKGLSPRSDPLEPYFGKRLAKIQIWPLGPRNRVDDGFQKLYLSGQWPAWVGKHDLALAKELFYACLIEEPREFEVGSSLPDREGQFGFTHELGLPFFPATHQNPAVRSFFDMSFEAGLDVVVTLTDFALEQRGERLAWQVLSEIADRV